jgi:hypothetical protein
MLFLPSYFRARGVWWPCGRVPRTVCRNGGPVSPAAWTGPFPVPTDLFRSPYPDRPTRSPIRVTLRRPLPLDHPVHQSRRSD